MGPIDAILSARKEGGKFASVEDFARRVSNSNVNKKMLESLAKCGAMDDFGDRATLLANVERILSYANKSQGTASNGQIDLFGGTGVEMPGLKLEPAPKMKMSEKLRYEKELLGIYISEHPMNEYKEQLLKLNVNPIVDLTESMNNQTVKIGGVLSNVQKVMTRAKQLMYFCWFEDSVGKTELIVFPKVIEESPELWVVGNVLLIRGKVSTKDAQVKVIVDKAIKLEGNMGEAEIQVVDPLLTQSVKVETDGKISIYIPRGTSAEALNDIKYKLAANKGDTTVFVYVPNGPSGPKKVKLPFGIMYTDKLGDSIRKRLHEN
jgi:DNA polymerase-3 subunit alpha